MFIYWIGGLLTFLAAIIIYYPAFFYIFLFIIYSVILIVLAVAGTIYVYIIISSKNHQPMMSHKMPNTLFDATCSPIFNLPKPITSSHLPIIFGRTVDGLLLQIIEYTIRDFISPWLQYVVRKPKLLTNILKEDIWNGVYKLKERSLRIDGSKMIAVDMTCRLTVHLEKLRIAQARSIETGNSPVFATTTYLLSEERELEFLRKLCEIIIIFLLPRGYSLSPLKKFLSEILSYKIFYPMITLVTSSDYINMKIIQFVETRLSAAAISKRCYEYAASFEEFIKIINASTNGDELVLIQTSVVNDLLQATTMQNLQRAKGLDSDSINECERPFSKSELSSAIRIKKYIQQLTFAKTQCEKQLIKLGCGDNFSDDINLTLTDILSTVIGRRYFMLFLEQLKASGLIGFYASVEELKTCQKLSTHQLGAEIYYTYIRAPSSEIKVDKSVRKKLESFLLGDIGAEIFFDVQKTVIQTLEEKYYSPFLSSQYYQELKNALTVEDFKDMSIIGGSFGEIVDNEHQSGTSSTTNSSTDSEATSTIDLQYHSTYAKNKLDQIQEKLENKYQALEAIRESVKPESKLLSVLEKEVNWLQMEKRQLESHLARTEMWSEHLGKWQASVQSVEVPDEKDPPKFMILVQASENTVEKASHPNGENISSGWVVLRSCTEFHDLNRKLRQMCKDLKSLDLPTSAFKMFFLKNDKNSLERAKGEVQKFLNFILENDDLCQCEAIYTFLSPSSEHLKYSTPVAKKSKFSLSTFFKSNTGNSLDPNKTDPFWGPCGQRDGEKDISMVLDGNISEFQNDGCNNKFHSSDTDGKDSIAEPLYALMDEVFSMGGVFKWFRRSLISFVQITYGRTINRQIRESINYLFEESMLHHYASTALKSFWPGGVLTFVYEERSQDEQKKTVDTAKSLVIHNIPEVLCNLVGEQTAKHGATKLFDTVQNSSYNKQLFYELVEILMIELFPEIRQLKPNIKSKTKKNEI